jgi:hypothetical protein
MRISPRNYVVIVDRQDAVAKFVDRAREAARRATAGALSGELQDLSASAIKIAQVAIETLVANRSNEPSP